MRVTVDRETDAETPGAQDVLVAQIEPVGMRVDLQGGAGAGGGAEHLVEVDVDGATATDLARGQVPDDVAPGVLARADDPPGHLVAGLPEVRVYGSDADVEAAQNLHRPVDLTVGVDVQLGAV